MMPKRIVATPDTNESKEQAKMKKTDESTLADHQIRVTVGSRLFMK